MEQSKACTKCKETKPLNQFSVEKKCKNGLAFHCKACAAIRIKKWKADNPEEVKARQKAWKQANPEYVAVSNKAWRQDNPEYVGTYRQTNANRIAAQERGYRAAHPEKAVIAYHKRRARLRGSAVFIITDKEVAKLYASPCAYCGKPSKHIDHVVPLSRGGRHSIGNLVGACANCNLTKNSKFITEWKRSQ